MAGVDVLRWLRDAECLDWPPALQPMLKATYYPLGFPLELSTDSPEIIRAAQESWGLFEQAFDEPAIELRISVGEGSEMPHTPAFVARDQILTLASNAANCIVGDLRRRRALGHLTAAAAAHGVWVRYYFLDAMVYTLLDWSYFTPVHSACVALDGGAVLLCGDSEAGKSSLSYACARKGWTFVSDDACHLLPGNGRVVVGNPHQLRLREAAREFFPELREIPATLRANGKMTIEVHTAELAGIRTVFQARVDHIVFINRQAGPARLLPYSADTAFRWMERVLGDGEFRASQTAALRGLLDVGVSELRYEDLDSGVEQLSKLVRGGG